MRCSSSDELSSLPLSPDSMDISRLYDNMVKVNIYANIFCYHFCICDWRRLCLLEQALCFGDQFASVSPNKSDSIIIHYSYTGYAYVCSCGTRTRTHTHTHLLHSLLRNKKVDITPSETRISTITIATTAPALLPLDFFLSLLPPLPLLLLPSVMVIVLAVVGGAALS